MSSIEPVKKQIVVEVAQEHAFRVFTDGIDRWWPRQHHVGKSPMKKTLIEPGVSGRWYAICEDGSECDVGKVLVWEPSGRVVLAWQLTAQWQFDPEFVTEVEVRFIVEGPKRTRVELEHRNLERYGEAAEGIRKSISAKEGWGIVLENFANEALRK